MPMSLQKLAPPTARGTPDRHRRAACPAPKLPPAWRLVGQVPSRFLHIRLPGIDRDARPWLRVSAPQLAAIEADSTEPLRTFARADCVAIANEADSSH